MKKLKKQKTFSQLNPNNALFIKMAANPPGWWEVLRNDVDVNIEIRKGNYIDVYYHGGAIIRKLKYTAETDSFSAEIHPEYIPVESKGSYIPYKFNGNHIEFDSGIKISPMKDFNAESLKAIKKRISGFFVETSEKAIQSKFIKNDPFYIDSEFQYPFKSGGNDDSDDSGEDGKHIRIDLIRIDERRNKIVFVEVKKMGDPRLYTDEIIKQLKKYGQFIKGYKDQLLSYYKTLYEIKKSLNILSSELTAVGSLDGYAICEKPLLLFGDCAQSWIDGFSPVLDDKIKHVALGSYYFGKPNYKSDIEAESKNNRHIFDKNACL